MRGRIWFHNEIHVFSTVFLCLLVCNGLLASKAHRIFFFVIVSFLNVQRSAMCFLFKKIIILLSEYVKACFYYHIRNTGFQMLQLHEVIFFLYFVLSLLYY